MRIASIDVGTNTVLLLIADVDEHGKFSLVHQEQRIPRLGRDVDKNGVIRVSAFDRIAWILQEYKNLAIQFQANHLVACATSAVRDAENQSEFISFIKNTSGIDIEVLTGEQEAIWTYRSATSEQTSSGSPQAVIDIGGGSTELIYQKPGTFNGNTKLYCYSLQLGSVRITERYLKHQPPLPEELASASKFIIEECSPIHNPGFHQYQLTGVAGTATTLACLDAGLKEFESKIVNGYKLHIDQISLWLHRLAAMTPQTIESLSLTTQGRADILTAGVLILHEVMKLLGFSELMVSERGLRFGLVLREWERLRQMQK